MNPEFLSEGEAVNDFLFPDRLVLGGIDERSIDALESLYEPFAGVPRLRTNTRTAEMIKYASNALLATLISFSNELANLGSVLGGIDSTEVMRGLHLSQYFGRRNSEGLPPITAFLAAGCGFGGSCLPKDVSALVAHGEAAGHPMPLLKSVMTLNRDQPRRTVALLRKHWTSLSGVKVAVLGLAFKPGTSDVRESPAFPIMRELVEEGAVVSACDPVALHEAQRAFPEPRVRYCALEDAIQDAEAIIVVTPWAEFDDLPAKLNGHHQGLVFVDGRRAFDKRSVPIYEGVGL
jgi:UDPglucose 6-dehydrogenase/GDP-mannose 6-dehydrogenase